MELILINEKDNVAVSSENGHKYAVRDIQKGEKVIKYGFTIGKALCDIKKGERVHTNNLKTLLTGALEYEYKPEFSVPEPQKPVMINGYLRADGSVGIRNEIWVIPTVGCVNGAAKTIAEKTGAFCFTHQFGCSQLGADLEETQKTLAGLIKHPNAGGVLVVGLGCENNGIGEMKKALGDYDDRRIRFLNCQDCEDEISLGFDSVNELRKIADGDIRTPVPISKIRLGLKCGGSDGFSGITANPMCGIISDRMISMGASAVLTEVPEMFGAEQTLFRRCADRSVFNDAVKMINAFKNYYTEHGQPVSENPSPGNREGGITTLEEKSLGCVQKGGTAPVTAVIKSGDTVKKGGLNLLYGPGNDPVAITRLASAGCQIILFTTGRGTPLGAPVPTIKIATNSALAAKKSGWTDFDASSGSADELMSLLIDVINGRQTKNEINNSREIAIFKNGVTL